MVKKLETQQPALPVGDYEYEPEPGEKSPEQIASEQNLFQLVADDAPQPGASETLAAEMPQTTAEESFKGLLLVCSMALNIGGMKQTAAVWDESACTMLAYSACPVLRKYAWGQKFIQFLETGSGVEEMALFATATPLVLTTAKAVQADLKKPEPEPKPSSNPEPVINPQPSMGGFHVVQPANE